MVLRFADFEFDRRRAELRGPDGKTIRLRSKPFHMLGLFADNAGRIVSKQELMEAVWPKFTSAKTACSNVFANCGSYCAMISTN